MSVLTKIKEGHQKIIEFLSKEESLLSEIFERNKGRFEHLKILIYPPRLDMALGSVIYFFGVDGREYRIVIEVHMPGDGTKVFIPKACFGMGDEENIFFDALSKAKGIHVLEGGVPGENKGKINDI